MKRLRVCIYGGTDLQGMPADFVSTLAFEVLDKISSVIVTGGFKHSNKAPGAISTDAAALVGARHFADVRGVPLQECYQAWVPEPSLDRRPDVKGVVRMSAADGIGLRVLPGLTPLGRRLAMVAAADLVVTISGKRHTEVVVEHALEQGIPVLPVPFAGGDSRVLLEAYPERISAAFGAGALDRWLAELKTTIKDGPQATAAAVVRLLSTAKFGRCLVLLPYDEEHDALYASVIEPAVASHMVPLRLDRNPSSESIYSAFAQAARTSSALIADVTRLNENVMYEIGYAHGIGHLPLLYTRDPARLDALPVYLRTLNVRLVSHANPIDRLINEYMLAAKASRWPVVATAASYAGGPRPATRV